VPRRRRRRQYALLLHGRPRPNAADHGPCQGGGSWEGSLEGLFDGMGFVAGASSYAGLGRLWRRLDRRHRRCRRRRLGKIAVVRAVHRAHEAVDCTEQQHHRDRRDRENDERAQRSRAAHFAVALLLTHNRFLGPLLNGPLQIGSRPLERKDPRACWRLGRRLRRRLGQALFGRIGHWTSLLPPRRGNELECNSTRGRDDEKTPRPGNGSPASLLSS
jgi:hypothetical protein